ncbi:MAG: hypothetical protein NTY68_02605, partial [Candidatus Micrarchaeota archaeon]|nr:hypothetical protein [Candidatus Micrarchaeota archaeon]
MPFQNQTRDSKSLKSPVSKEGDKEPLLEHVKSKFMRAAIKKMRTGVKIAGLSLALLAAKPAITVAQDTINKEMPRMEQITEKKILKCYLDFETMMNYFTSEESKKNNALFKAMFDGLGQAKSNIISGTDTIKGFEGIKESFDFSKTNLMKKSISNYLQITSEEFERISDLGKITSKVYTIGEKEDNLLLYLDIIKKDGIISKNKQKLSGIDILITFYSKNENGFVSLLRFPKEFDIFDVKPFFGTKTDKDTQFGLYIRYKKENKTYELINNIIYI